LAALTNLFVPREETPENANTATASRENAAPSGQPPYSPYDRETVRQ
jgi:hypothetical protein